MDELIDKIRGAMCDPNAPWYGSDVFEWVADLIDRAEKAEAEVERLREVLDEISEGKGTFDLDHHQHAKNTIEDMKELALRALSPAPPTEEKP